MHYNERLRSPSVLQKFGFRLRHRSIVCRGGLPVDILKHMGDLFDPFEENAPLDR